MTDIKQAPIGACFLVILPAGSVTVWAADIVIPPQQKKSELFMPARHCEGSRPGDGSHRYCFGNYALGLYSAPTKTNQVSDIMPPEMALGR
jgi:hypothetical protein